MRLDFPPPGKYHDGPGNIPEKNREVSTMHKPIAWDGILYLLLTVLLFSTFEVAGKLVSPVLHPLQITLYRFVIGGLVLLPFALVQVRKEKIRISLPSLGVFAMLGFVNIAVSMVFIQYGIASTNASTAAAIFSSNPVFVALFAFFLLGEKITLPKILGVIFGVAGVSILFMEKMQIRPDSWIGPLLVIIAALFFGLYTVLGKKVSCGNVAACGKTGSLVMNAFSFLIGSVFLIPLMLFLKVPLVNFQPSTIPTMLYLGIFVTGLAYLFYFMGLEKVSASAGSLVYFLKPVLASIFSVIVLHETLRVPFYTGTAVILIGIGAVNFNRFKRWRP